jgi:hypothetical protein
MAVQPMDHAGITVADLGAPGRHQDVYRPCYVRGPQGIPVELAERIG